MFRALVAFALAVPTVVVAADEFCGDWKVNWFHLQHQAAFWQGHMQTLTDQYQKLAKDIDAKFPGSKMGAAGFYDKAIFHEDFVLISELTDKDTAVSKMLEAYPASWHPELPLDAITWPEDDSSTPDSGYHAVEGKMPDLVDGCFEPLIWAALHEKWDTEEGIFKLFTIAMAGLPHFDGDGSADEASTKEYSPFSRETYPASETRYWPSATKPKKVGTSAKYASIDLIKEILHESKFHLIVLYSIDGNGETPVKGWRKVLTDIAIDYNTSLFYMSMDLNVEASVLEGLKKGTCDPDHDDIVDCCAEYCSV